MVGCGEKGHIKSKVIEFYEDGSYYGYIVNDTNGYWYKDYEKTVFHHWVKFYDDEGLVTKLEADTITIVEVINIYENKQYLAIQLTNY
jgi:hypothetical protein